MTGQKLLTVELNGFDWLRKRGGGRMLLQNIEAINVIVQLYRVSQSSSYISVCFNSKVNSKESTSPLTKFYHQNQDTALMENELT